MARSSRCSSAVSSRYDESMVARSVRCRSSSGPCTSGRQVERAVEPLADGAQRHHRDLPRGELDAQRQPVEPAQHLDEVRRLRRPRQLVARRRRAGVLDERAHAGLPPQCVEVGRRRAGPAAAAAARRTPRRPAASPATWRARARRARSVVPRPPARGTRRPRARSCPAPAAARGLPAQRRCRRDGPRRWCAGPGSRRPPGTPARGGRRRRGRRPRPRSSAARSAAMSRASLVLPTPPGPVSVTTACEPRRPNAPPRGRAAARPSGRPAGRHAGRPGDAATRPDGDLLLQLGQRRASGRARSRRPAGVRNACAAAIASAVRPSAASARTCSNAVRSRSGDAAAAAAASTTTRLSARQPRLEHVVDELQPQLVKARPTRSPAPAATRNSASAGPRHSSSAATLGSSTRLSRRAASTSSSTARAGSRYPCAVPLQPVAQTVRGGRASRETWL